jgi:acyl dehydratase
MVVDRRNVIADRSRQQRRRRMSTDDWNHSRALGRDFDAPASDRWFEDYNVGDIREYGTIELSEADVVGFARRYDPQPIHCDPSWAATGPFGGIIASGIQTMGVFMRLYADHYVSRQGSLSSPGVDEVRFPRPVRPGDALWLRAEPVDRRVSTSKPDRGLVVTAAELLDQDKEVVMSLRVMNIVAVRPAEYSPRVR